MCGRSSSPQHNQLFERKQDDKLHATEFGIKSINYLYKEEKNIIFKQAKACTGLFLKVRWRKQAEVGHCMFLWKPDKKEQRRTLCSGECRLWNFLRVYSLQDPGLITKFDLHPSRIALGFPDIKDGWVVGKSHAFRIPCAARAESMMPAEDRNTTTNKRQSNS